MKQPDGGFSLGEVRWAITAVVSAAALFFAVIYVQNVAPIGSLTRDPTVTAEEPWYLGFASSLGVVGWAIAAGFFGLGAILVQRRGGRGVDALGLAVAYSLLLLVDDLYLLHDDILLRVVGSEEPVYAVYALLGILWATRARRYLNRPTAILLVATIAAMSSSLAIDLAWDSQSDLRLVAEDGLKFTGIWLWALFALALATDLTEQAVEDHPSSRDHDE